MVKLVLLFRKRTDISHEEFFKYWIDVHVPLVTKVPGIRRYVISPIFESPILGRDYDGMAELWFDTETAAHHALETEETRATGRDARNFIMKGSLCRFLCTEQSIIEPQNSNPGALASGT